ncbi:hypothetical protein VUR80DRAFT_10242 [Thermomyces stellatus]
MMLRAGVMRSRPCVLAAESELFLVPPQSSSLSLDCRSVFRGQGRKQRQIALIPGGLTIARGRGSSEVQVLNYIRFTAQNWQVYICMIGIGTTPQPSLVSRAKHRFLPSPPRRSLVWRFPTLSPIERDFCNACLRSTMPPTTSNGRPYLVSRRRFHLKERRLALLLGEIFPGKWPSVFALGPRREWLRPGTSGGDLSRWLGPDPLARTDR